MSLRIVLIILLLSSILFFICLNSIVHCQTQKEIAQVDITIMKGVRFLNDRKIQEALKEFEFSLEKSQTSNYTKGELHSRFYIAFIIVGTNPNSALEHAQEALKLAEEINDISISGYCLNIIGSSYAYLGQLDEALESHHKARAIFNNLGNKNNEVEALNHIGRIISMRGDHRGALDYFEKALLISEESNNDTLVRNTLFEIGKSYASINRYNDALDYFSKSLEISRKQKDKNYELTVQHYIGNILVNKGEYNQALSIFLDSLSSMQNLGPSFDHALVLAGIGQCYLFTGQYTKARSFYDDSLSMLNKMNTPFAGAIYVEISSFYEKSGEFKKAIETLNRAIALNKKTDFNFDSFLMIRLGKNYLKIGDTLNAESYFDQAIELNEKNTNLMTKASNYLELGNIYSTYRDAASALNLFSRAREIYIELNNEYQITKLNITLANFFLSLGKYFDALFYLTQVPEESYSSLPTIELINIYSLQGNVYDLLGNTSEAIKFYQNAIELSREIGAKLSERYNITLLARLYFKGKKYKKSLEILKESLKLSNEFDDELQKAIIFENLAANYLALDLIPESMSLIQDSIKINSKHNNEVALLSNYFTQSEILKKQGLLKEALQSLLRAEKIKEGVSKRFKEKEFLSYYLDSYSHINEELIDTLQRLNESERSNQYLEEAFIFAEKAKARSLVEMLNEAINKIGTGLPEEIVLENNTLYERKKSLIGFIEDTNDIEERKRLIAEVVKIDEELLDMNSKVRDLNPDFYYLMNPKYMTIEEVQKRIISTNDMAILEYYIGSEKSFLFIISKNKSRIIRLTKTNKEFFELIKKIREPFDRVKEGSFLISELERFDEEVLNQLFDDLIRPALPYLDEIEKLVIIPHGSLNYLSFEMLRFADENEKNQSGQDTSNQEMKFLVEDFSISYAQSASVLNPDLTSGITSNSTLGDALIIAAPTMSRQSSQAENESKSESTSIMKIRSNEFGELPYSALEASLIAKHFRNSQVFLAEEATKANFVNNCADYPIIHISTHGILDEFFPIYSGLLFSKKNANDVSNILHVYEVFNVKLYCDLIVLSACETAIGQELEKIGGEGVQGLSRAFMYAGAKSLVVSLWPVSDESTSILMSEFYRNMLQNGMSKAEALRAAKLSLMKREKKIGNRTISYSHPFFWAPFILIGDPGKLELNSNSRLRDPSSLN